MSDQDCRSGIGHCWEDLVEVRGNLWNPLFVPNYSASLAAFPAVGPVVGGEIDLLQVEEAEAGGP